MKRKISAFVLLIMLASLFAACGASPTNTPVPPPATTAAPAPTTAAPVAPTAAPATTAPVATTAAPPATTAAASPTAAAGAAYTIKPAPVAVPPPASAKKGGTLTIGQLGLPVGIAPLTVSANITNIRANIFNLIWTSGLVEYNYTSLEWTYDLAKDLKISADGKTYTFTLRNDIKWSDGTPITVDDFKYSFDNISKPNPSNPALSYSSLQDKLLIKGYEVDKAAGTVAATLDKSYNREVALNLINNTIAPKHVWDGKPFFDPAGNPEILKPTVTSGPYKVKSYDDKSQGVFERNANWHRGTPNFDEVIVKAFSPTVISEGLKNGQADVTVNAMPSAFFKDLSTSPNLDLKEWTSLQDNYRYIVFNTTRAPFDDKQLRLALAHTFDRNVLITAAEAGRATPAFSITAEESPFFPAENPRFPFDLAKAKSILEQGGYKLEGGKLMGKDGKPLTFKVSHSGNDPQGKGLATIAQAQFKLVGIDVEVESKDPQSYLTDLVTQKYDAGIGLVGDLVFPDPDTQKTFFIKEGVFNVAKFALPRIDEIFKDLGPVEQDTAKRKALYAEAFKLVTENVPSIAFYRVKSYVAVNKKVGGIDLSKFKGGYIHLNGGVANWYFTS
jgi:peptide/nickel transport system substrate-binding protein